MGMSAVRQVSPAAVALRPRLHLVKPGVRIPGSPAQRPRPTLSRAHSAAREVFVLFAVLVAVVAILGVGRVWLSVQAAQASIDSSALRHEIKQERYRGDMLEIQQSALATPSRIQAIAGTTMGMTPAVSVSYLDMRGEESTDRAAKAGAVATSDSTDGLMARIMDVAADEAQALLVGDVGLASSE